MSSRGKSWRIPFPTERKVRNRGFTPILYFSSMGRLSGWIVSEAKSATRIALLTSDPRRQRIVMVRGKARRYIVTLDEHRRRCSESQNQS